MQNLEQKRAAHALERADSITKGCGGGDPTGVVKKVPAMVISSGILSAMAFAKEKEHGYESVFLAFVDYSEEIYAKDLSGALDELCQMSAGNLRRITAEFMAYISYLRRFVTKKEKE